jgi:hypothetical protein
VNGVATTRLQVFYQLGEGEKWSNVYHVDVTTITDAITAFTSHMQAPLLSFLHASCRITKVLSSSLVDDSFQEASIEEAGTSAFTDSRLPFFNCVKLLISTTGFGRPDGKFLKGWLTEGNTSSGLIDDTALTDLLGDYQQMIDDMASESTPFVSNTGDEWAIVTAPPTIQMRQMHRRRRHVTP